MILLFPCFLNSNIIP